MDVRVRYAPSPTGLQHIGGVRTALFNYFFAKSQGGKFILRVEDTDQERYSDESLQDLYDTFKWLDIHWDEGPDVGGEFAPYVQSERQAIYQEYAQKLIDDGMAYYCYCSSERLQQLREQQVASKSSTQGYDRACRDLTAEQRAEYEKQGILPVIRLKVPEKGVTAFDDILLGTIKRQNSDISPDPVIMKSDGMPTYHLANVIDDHFMKITHILRAQEWIPSGPLHVIMYKAFGWEPPIYCHLPMVMGKDGQKLSKRHGSTSLRDFIKDGYLPEAIINYVTMVGWSYDDSREFFTKEDLEQLFSIEKINKAPGVFDYKKLQWFNGQYIRQKSDSQLAELVLPYLQDAGFVSNPTTDKQNQILFQLIPIVKERLRLLSDIVAVSEFLFKGPKEYEAELLIPKKKQASDAAAIIASLKSSILPIFDMSDSDAEAYIVEEISNQGFKTGDYLMVLRVALTGSTVSPPIVESIKIFGKEKSLAALDVAENKILSLI
ncbi:MAG: glutamate--tRNA ligase [Spirochaetales bacterium]|nr:glutamate--tRNA ligase [Spirochaetales bacterium]